MAKKWKDNENSTISFLKKTDEYTDEFGRHVVKGKWQIATEDINLGSEKNPNKNILQFKIEVEEDRPKNPLGDMLGDLFGGRKWENLKVFLN